MRWASIHIYALLPVRHSRLLYFTSQPTDAQQTVQCTLPANGSSIHQRCRFGRVAKLTRQSLTSRPNSRASPTATITTTTPTIHSYVRWRPKRISFLCLDLYLFFDCVGMCISPYPFFTFFFHHNAISSVRSCA